MNMGALFSYAVEQLEEEYDDIAFGDYGFCWPCTLRNAYRSAVHPKWPTPDWYQEVAESL